MHRQRAIQWLYSELPTLVSQGVLSGEAAAQLQHYYGTVSAQHRHARGLIVCSILGALLIGLGSILLVAHNWDELSRPVRTVLAFLPLLVGQGLTGWAMWARPHSVGWGEGTAVLLCMAIGVCIALVGQTYHMPGDMATFLLVWMGLGMPLIYLVPASLPAALVWAVLPFWIHSAQQQWGHALLFWPLAAVPVPHLWNALRHHPSGQRAVLLRWVFGLSLSIAPGLLLTYTVPGLWLPVYAGLFAVLYLLDGCMAGNAPTFWQHPWRTIGAAGLGGMAILLTYDEPWRALAWGQGRPIWPPQHWVVWQDYALAIGLLALTLGLAGLVVRRQQPGNLLFGLAPILVAVSYVIVAAGGAAALPMLLFNGYVLALGVGTIRSGLQHGRMGTMNGGLLLVSALIVLRFFDMSLSFTVRGLVFMVLGVACLGVNVMLRRRGADA